MHQLWRHENGNWYVLYGPRLRRRISAKTTDRGEAEKFLARFIAVSGEPEGLPTLGEILVAYQADKTLRAPASLKYAIAGLQPLHALYHTQITPAAVRAWVKGRGASDGTVLREIGVVRAAIRWAVEHMGLPPETVRPISNPVPTPAPRSRWLTKEEAQRLVDATREPHVRLFILLAIHTVARTGAILEARWSQVNWDRRYIDYGAAHGNKRRARPPLNSEIYTVLEGARRIACSDHIVEWRGEPVTSVRTGFSAAVGRAKLPGNVTPHILRHSGASWLVEAGVPDEEVARMLGDSVEMVRKVYGHFRPEYLARAAAALQLGTK